MTAGLNFIQYNEPMAGAGGNFSDTLNRALMNLLNQSGYNASAATFPGLYGPVFNVAAYYGGALPTDGTTSISTALTNALADAAVGGGRVLLPYTVNGYNIGSTGITVASNVTLEGLAGAVPLKFSGTGFAFTLEGDTTALKNVTVLCSNDACVGGVRVRGTAAMANRNNRMDNVVSQFVGTPLNCIGAAFTFDSGPQFCDAFKGGMCYGLGWKIGVDVIGQSAGTSTWSVIRFDRLDLVGQANSANRPAGSVALRADANSNLEASSISAGVIEGFRDILSFAAGASCFGFSYEGGSEGNTNAAPAFPVSYAGTYYDPHSDIFYRATANGVANRWMAEKIQTGQWTSESRYDRIHVIYDGGGTAQKWGLQRGGSAANGEFVTDKFIVSTGASGAAETPGTDWFKLNERKTAWGSAVPVSGSWEIGSIIQHTTPFAGYPVAWKLSRAGTLKAALSGVTGNTTSGSNQLTLSSVSTIEQGDFLQLAGPFSSGARVVSLAGNVATMSYNAATTQTGGAVSYLAPTFAQTAWMPGASVNNGDASVTLTATSETTQRFTTALTANRTVTLPANAASGYGQKFRIVRAGLGAFTLTVQDAASNVLKVLPSATGAWCDVEFDANTNLWFLAAYGTL